MYRTILSRNFRSRFADSFDESEPHFPKASPGLTPLEALKSLVRSPASIISLASPHESCWRTMRPNLVFGAPTGLAQPNAQQRKRWFSFP